MRDEVEEFTLDKCDGLGVQHESLRIQRPVVWIPDDRLGISEALNLFSRCHYSMLHASHSLSDTISSPE